jgi:hypothetical protein
VSQVSIDVDLSEALAAQLIGLAESVDKLADTTTHIAAQLRHDAWPDAHGSAVADGFVELAADLAGAATRAQGEGRRLGVASARGRLVIEQPAAGGAADLFGSEASDASTGMHSSGRSRGAAAAPSEDEPWQPTGVDPEYVELVGRAWRLSSGRKGEGWNDELNNPKPSTAYIVDNKFLFVTDELGRTVYVKTVLTRDGMLDGVDQRNRGEQLRAGRRRFDSETATFVPLALGDGIEGRGEYDDGGHLIAAQFCGIGEALNVVAQHQNVNRSRTAFPENWYAAERAVKTMLTEQPQLAVEWEARIVYAPRSVRPERFRLRFQQQGSRARRYTMENPRTYGDE